ncbi:hypothetical protein NDU88_002263 [Pleurodeles waltl]|uniref:Uncharacterized protein n=1 Tax=Pleurodeles waltl TaxID=8319 RepID=A0AAV7VYV3_PLEWA|nr:hypothetical protein NDU88_002263 [Pleurodeles waltl]
MASRTFARRQGYFRGRPHRWSSPHARRPVAAQSPSSARTAGRQGLHGNSARYISGQVRSVPQQGARPVHSHLASRVTPPGRQQRGASPL